MCCCICFFFNDPATTEIYTLSLHDALPIWWPARRAWWANCGGWGGVRGRAFPPPAAQDRKSTRLNSSHANISYAVFCLKKKKARQQAKNGSTLNKSPNILLIRTRSAPRHLE